MADDSQLVRTIFVLCHVENSCLLLEWSCIISFVLRAAPGPQQGQARGSNGCAVVSG
jgi:hypothetical protein